MKSTLTAIALLAALGAGTTTVSANPHIGHNEGLQNYYYYFGAPCCGPIAQAPCGMPAPAPACGSPCGECAVQYVPVEYEQVCRTTSCDPCGGGGLSFLNPFSYFG